MMLDIKPQEHNVLYNCLEDLFSVLAGWRGHGCELMFAKSWGFSFLRKAIGEEPILGNRIDSGGYNNWECLDRYYGMKSQFNFKEPPKEQLKLLADELEAGRPVILSIDSFWVRWNKTYQKFHRQHYCIAMGMDKDNESICCIDPFWNMEINLLERKNFIKGNTKCISLSFVDRDKDNIKWDQIIKEAVSMVRGNEENTNIFEDMRSFADEVEANLDIAAEVKGCEEWVVVAPLFMQINQIGATRFQFAKVIDYLAKECGAPQLAPLAEKMENAGQHWRKILKIGIREYDNPEKDVLIKEFSAELRKIADMEESLAGEMLDAVKEN